MAKRKHKPEHTAGPAASQPPGPEATRAPDNGAAGGAASLPIIAGIGASAGGVEAPQAFFEALPEKTGVAEEIEMSREELQSTNEVLHTVNAGLKAKLDEFARTHDDLQNLLTATEIGTLLLDGELRIKRFTPALAALFNVTASDCGRPIADFTHRLDYPLFEADARAVLDGLVAVGREVRTRDGEWYIARLRPYRTTENRIDGVVAAFVDVTAWRAAEDAVRAARDYAEGIVATVREPLLVLTADLRVRSANPAFYRTFHVRPEETEGRLVYALGNGQWDVPALRTLLEEVLPTNEAFNDFEVTHDFEHIGRRTMLLNARRFEDTPLVLLAIEDVTERAAAAARDALRVKLADALRLFGDPDEVRAVAARMLGEHLGASRFFYGEADADGEHFLIEHEYTRGVPSIAGRYRLDDFGPAHVADIGAGRTVVVADVTADARLSDDERAAYAAIGVGAHVSVPLMRGGRVVAFCTAQHSTPRAWTADEAALVEEVAERTWATVERARAEAALRASEARFRDTANAAPATLWITDPDGACAFLSRGWHEFTGQTEAEGLGFGWLDAVHPDDREEAGRTFLAANARREPFALDHRLRRADGVYRWVIDSGRPLLGEDGGFLGYVGSVLDIHDRKEAEAALRQSESQLELALATAEMGTWTWDLATGLGTFDARGAEIVGLGGAVAPDEPFDVAAAQRAAVHPDDLPVLEAAIAAGLAAGGTFVLRYRVAPGGRVRHVVSNVRVETDAAGRPVRLSGTNRDVTAEREAEAALRRSEERARLLVEGARDYAIFGLDLARRVTSWNLGAERLLGWTEAEIAGQSADVIFTPEDRAAGAPEWEVETAEAEGRAPDERWHLRKDGSRFWGSGVLSPLRDEDGRLTGFVKVFRDLTARRAAEVALRESEERYRLLLEGVRDYAIFQLDASGRVIEWPEGAERVKGYAPEEVLGRHLSMFFPPEAVAAGEPDRELAEAAATGRAERESWRVRKGGERFWVNEIATALYDAEGALVGFTKISRDLTERRAADEMLRQREAQFRRAITAAAVPVMMHADDGEILAVSDAVVELTGYARDALLRIEDWTRLAYGDRAAECTALIEGGFREGLPVEQLELPVRTRAGNVRTWVFSAGPPERLPDGRRYYVCFANDITERVRMEEALRDLNETLEARVRERAQEVSQLANRLTVAEQEERHRLAQVLHDDLQQQLFGLSVTLGLLHDPRSPEEAEELQQRAGEVVAEATALTRSLALELSPPVLADEQIGELLRWLAARAKRQHGLEVEVEVDGPCEVPDRNVRVLLDRVLREALFNVAKHAGADRARLRARREGAEVVVHVEDGGAGFDAETAAGRDAGMGGFGLASARERLRLIGGRIELDSAPGRGTRVTVAVPSNGANPE